MLIIIKVRHEKEMINQDTEKYTHVSTPTMFILDGDIKRGLRKVVVLRRNDQLKGISDVFLRFWYNFLLTGVFLNI